MISSSSPRPIRLAAVLAALCSIGLSVVASSPATAGVNVIQVSSAARSNCVVKPGDGSLLCWGRNQYLQNNVPAGLGAVAQVSTSTFNTCAIKQADRTVACWGYNANGQSTPPGSLGAVSQVSTSGNHACAIKQSGGGVACWGYNFVGTTTVPGSLGAAFQISAGLKHNCAVRNSDGAVLCWGGANSYGERTVPAGLGAASQVSTWSFHTCAIRQSDGGVVCWGQNTYGQTTVPAGLGAASQVSAGNAHTCAIRKSDSALFCWGNNLNGQRNIPAGLGAVTQVSAGEMHTCAVRQANGALVCWGSNFNGESAVPDLIAPEAPASFTGVSSTPTSNPNATIGFTLAESGGTVECRVDGGSWGPCDSVSGTGGSHNTSGLSDGTHTLEVRQTDAAGNVGAIGSTTWTVDTTPPTVTLTGVPSDPTDATHAVIHFHSEHGVTYTCVVDGGEPAPCASPLELSGLADGTHSVSVVATDAAGNSSIAATASWTVDSTAHAPPYVSLISPDASPASQTTASIEYDGESGATFLCSLDGGTYAACPPAPVLLTGLSDGTHTYSVKQVDGFGRESDPATVTWTVDTTPPPTPRITTKPSSTTTSSSATIGFSGSGEPGGVLECKVDGGDWGPCPASPLALESLSNGSHRVEVRETDAAGNTGPAAIVDWTVQAVTAPSCSPQPVPPTPTKTVTATRVRGNLWSLNAGSVFNTGGDTRGCAQLLTVQITTVATKPTNDDPGPIAPSYAKGIVAWTGSAVERASAQKPRWIRVENRIGHWSGWVAVK